MSRMLGLIYDYISCFSALISRRCCYINIGIFKLNINICAKNLSFVGLQFLQLFEGNKCWQVKFLQFKRHTDKNISRSHFV